MHTHEVEDYYSVIIIIIYIVYCNFIIVVYTVYCNFPGYWLSTVITFAVTHLLMTHSCMPHANLLLTIERLEWCFTDVKSRWPVKSLKIIRQNFCFFIHVVELRHVPYIINQSCNCNIPFTSSATSFLMTPLDHHITDICRLACATIHQVSASNHILRE